METVDPELPRICDACLHRGRGGPLAGGPERDTCTAFPQGIPIAIWSEGHDHRLPFPGDGGVRFELARTGDAALRRFAAAGLAGTNRSDRAPQLLRPHRRGVRPSSGGPAQLVPPVLERRTPAEVAARWPLDPEIVVDLELAEGVVTILRLGCGSQPADVAGWLIATAVFGTEVAPRQLRLRVPADHPDVQAMRSGRRPEATDLGDLLSDAAGDLGMLIAALALSEHQGTDELVADLKDWPGPRW